ncbi:unnamed protein product [Symbiodinium sp. KB8]|nr:unnamed protein product [Symbiodinium sp. KB8]
MFQQQQPERRSELLSQVFWLVSRSSQRQRVRHAAAGAEEQGGEPCEVDDEQRQHQQRRNILKQESVVTQVCRRVFRKAQRDNAAPNFEKSGQVGKHVERIWNALLEGNSAEIATGVFTGAEQTLGVVTGLVRVSIQHLEYGPLAILDWEERFAWEYFNRLPCVFLKVEQTYSLLDVDANRRKVSWSSQRPHVISSIHPGLKDDLVRLPQVQAFLREQDLQEHVSCLALQVWPPVAYLLAMGRMSFFGIGGMLRNLPRGSPAELRAAWREACRFHAGDAGGDQEDNRGGVLQNPHSLRVWASHIRAWAVHVLHGRANNQNQDPDEQRFLLETCVQIFEHEADNLEAHHGASPWMEGFGRFGFQRRYKMVQLLRLVLLVRDIRTATKTKEVLISALRAVFPPEALEYLQSMIADVDEAGNGIVPSKAVLYNMRFVVDLSLMLHMRTVLRANFMQELSDDDIMWYSNAPAVYLLADSSPQGGKNLLNSEYSMVLAKDILELARIAVDIRETLQALSRDDLQEHELKNFLEEHDALLEAGCKLFRHHANIPVVLGSGHAGLVHEFVALQHAVFMETGCSRTLASWNRCVVSITTDRGVEKGLNKMQPLSFGQAFPHFKGSRNPEGPGNIDLEFEEDGGRVEPGPPLVPAVGARDNMLHDRARIDEGVSLHLLHSLDVGGAMHSLHNISLGFLSSMRNYDTYFWPKLQALTRFLHAPYYRERFCEKCLVGNLEPMGALLESFPYKLVQWRWLTITAVVPQLLQLEHVLVAGWDPGRMGVRVGAEHQHAEVEDEYHNMSWDLVHEAIRSTDFWAWLRMLSILTSIMGYIERWFFGCECHFEKPTLQNLMQAVRVGAAVNRQDVRDRSKFVCPFRQRRGPELASGDFLAMVETLCLVSSQELVSVVIPACSEQGRARVAEDFQCARQHLSFHLKVQFSAWSMLPRVLVGIMHSDVEKARHCAIMALTQYSDLRPEQQEQSHFLVKSFLDPAGRLRPLMCRFIAGESLISLPLLHFHVVRLGLVPVVEITVEGMHAVIQSAIKRGSHHSSMPTISLANRWSEFLDALSVQHRFEWFANTCLQIYHPLRAAPVFGVDSHPTLHGAYPGNDNPNLLHLLGSTFKWTKRVKGLIYRSDRKLALQDLPGIDKPKPSPKSIVVQDEEALLNLEAFRAFVETVDRDCFYSVPVKLALPNNGISELRVVPAPEQMGVGTRAQEVQMPSWLKKECGLDDVGLEFEDAEAFGLPSTHARLTHRQCADADHFFFQLLSKHPSRLKQDINAFSSGDVAVSQHTCVRLEAAGGTKAPNAESAMKAVVETLASNSYVSMSSSHAPEGMCQWILPGLENQASHLRKALLWEHDEFVHCVANHTAPIGHDVKQLLEHAVEYKATPGSSNVLPLADCTEEEQACLKKADPEYFSFVPSLSGYQMTHQATDMLSFQRLLKNPKPLLLADRDAPFKEQTTFTLLSALFAAGWKLLRAKPKVLFGVFGYDLELQ